LGTCWTAQPEAAEAKHPFKMREGHFDFLPVVFGLFVFWRSLQAADFVARVFVD